jgi:hypothetical protein
MKRLKFQFQRRRGIFEKKCTANLAGEDKRKEVCGTHFVKKLMGVLCRD